MAGSERPPEMELLAGLRAVDAIAGAELLYKLRSDAAGGRVLLSLSARLIEGGRWPWLNALLGGFAGLNLICRLSVPRASCSVLLMSATTNNRRQLEKVEETLADFDPKWMEVLPRREPSRVFYALREVLAHPGTSFRVLRLLSRLMEGKRPLHAIGLARYVVTNLGMRRALRRIDPDVVVVSNDHTPACVGVAAAARAQGRRTAYLQHAHVSPLFPPLNFSLSVLDSRAALDIYEAKGPRRGHVVFKGVDGDSLPIRLRKFTESDPKLTIGIVVNNSCPNPSLVEGLSRLLGDKRVERLFVRPHPASPLSWYDNLPAGVELRMPQEPLAEVARHADLIFAGNTSAVLEALKSGAPTILWESIDQLADDYYGFVRYRLVPTISDPLSLSLAEVCNFFSGDWPVRMRYFDASYMNENAADLRGAFLDLLKSSRP